MPMYQFSIPARVDSAIAVGPTVIENPDAGSRDLASFLAFAARCERASEVGSVFQLSITLSGTIAGSEIDAAGTVRDLRDGLALIASAPVGAPIFRRVREARRSETAPETEGGL